MKAYSGRGGITPFITSAVDGDDCSTSCHGHFSPKKEKLYLLNRRKGGPHSRSGRFGEDEVIIIIIIIIIMSLVTDLFFLVLLLNQR